MITVSAPFKAELERESGAKPVILLTLNFTTGNRRFALWIHDVVFGGNTFFGLGPVRQVDPSEHMQDTVLSEQGIVFMVQNDPSFLLDLQQNSRGRFCTGRLVFLDSDGIVINNESIMLWQKRMVPGQSVGDSGTYTSGVALESRFHRNRNRSSRTYSHAEQLRRDATDFAFFDAGKTSDFTRANYQQKSGLS